MEQVGNDSVLRPDDFSDAGNAEVYVRAYRGMLAWCDALGWLYFNGKRWEQNDHKALEAATNLSAKMLEDARLDYSIAVRREADLKVAVADGQQRAEDALKEAQQEVKAASAYVSHAKKSRGVARIKAVLELAKPDMVVKADQLDADPFLLNCPGGVIDLRTSKIKSHGIDSPYLFCTKITNATPEVDPEGAQLWVEFMDTITCGDASLYGFLQMVVGMAAIGHVYREGIIICCGGGRNGKSSFWNAISTVLGDYAGSIDPDVLTTDKQRRGASLATLRGKRLVIAGEMEEHQRLSTSTLKRLASTDKLTIEEKYRQPEDIVPSHTLILFTNFLPRVGSTDNGTWRRLCIVPFNAVIPEGTGQQNYADYLVEHAGRFIMTWIMQGAKMFIENGYKLTTPDVVEETTDAYRDRENWLENFITERCVKEPDARVGARNLYLEYKSWSTESGEYTRRENDFKAALERAGYQQITPQNRKTWLGLRLAQGYENAGNHWGATG